MNITLLASLFGALSTFWLSGHRGFGPIRASALLSLVVSLAFLSMPLEPSDAQNIAACFYGGSFVGMTARSKAWVSQIAIAGLLFGLIFYFLSPLLPGMGGALGVSAFLSVVAVFALSGLGAKFYWSHRK